MVTQQLAYLLVTMNPCTNQGKHLRVAVHDGSTPGCKEQHIYAVWDSPLGDDLELY
jgi:pyrimidine deaminase RibD-like protein